LAIRQTALPLRDSISRFAFFYSDRLKNVKPAPIPQVAFFYDQLNELMNVKAAPRNETDHNHYSAAMV